MGKRRASWCSSALVCLVLLASSPAWAQNEQEAPPERARIVALSSEGLRKAAFAPGEPFLVLGEGFGAEEGGTIFLRRQTNELLSEFSTDEDGRFRADLMIRGEPFGGATLIVGTQSAVASVSISVVRPSRATQSIPTRDRNVVLLGTIAVALVFGGITLLFGARGRKRRSVP